MTMTDACCDRSAKRERAQKDTWVGVAAAASDVRLHGDRHAGDAPVVVVVGGAEVVLRLPPVVEVRRADDVRGGLREGVPLQLGAHRAREVRARGDVVEVLAVHLLLVRLPAHRKGFVRNCHLT